MRTRTHLLQVWLDDKENDILTHRSQKAGVPKSTFIRQLIHGLQPRDQPPPDYRLMMRQLYHCGNALNQIARKAHALNVLDVQKYDEAIQAYKDTVARIEQAVIEPEKVIYQID